MQREGRHRRDSDKSIWRRNTKCNILFVSFCLGLCRCFHVRITELAGTCSCVERSLLNPSVNNLCKAPLPLPLLLPGSCWTDVQRCWAGGAALPGEIIHP